MGLVERRLRERLTVSGAEISGVVSRNHMGQFWQRQEIYAQVTALGPLAKSLRSTSITPDSAAKLCQTIPRFTRFTRTYRMTHLSLTRRGLFNSTVASSTSPSRGAVTKGFSDVTGEPCAECK